MEFIKKILVLKQVAEGFSPGNKPVSGIFRLEEEGGVTTAFLSVINLPPVSKGNFRLYFSGKDKKLFSADLGNRPASFTKAFESFCGVKNGVTAGIAYVCDGLPVLVAFSKTDDAALSVSELKKAITETCIAEKKAKGASVSSKKPAEPVITEPVKTDALEKDEKAQEKELNAVYDDEVVATENYYGEEELKEKLKLIERLDNGDVRIENAMPSFGSEEKESESGKNAYGFSYETDLGGGEEYNESFPYFDTVRGELDGIMDKFPPEKRLTGIIPYSKWVKINYSEEKYYVVGIVNENDKEKYICYGVPAKYSLDPPKELKGFCSFIPLSVFDMKGEGYWMMFQDAVTGECVKINE